MTEDAMRDLVKDCGLDWQRGYMPLFDGDPTNRYAVLIESAQAAALEAQAAQIEALRAEVNSLRLVLGEARAFWAHYSSLNEGEQDDLNELRHQMLAAMAAKEPR
jgi:hypothetical protein